MSSVPSADTARTGLPRRRANVPVILQMEGAECGAVSLAMVLAAHGAWVPLEELRTACAVSRDGSNARNLALAAQRYGLEVAAHSYDIPDLAQVSLPAILFWNFNHFVVLTGTGPTGVTVNDPAAGHRVVDWEETDRSFTGIVLELTPTASFEPVGRRPGVRRALRPLLRGMGSAIALIALVGLLLVLPTLIVPGLLTVFTNTVVVAGNPAPQTTVLVWLLITVALSWWLVRLQQSVIARLDVAFGTRLGARVVDHVLRLPMTFFSQRSAGDVAQRVSLSTDVAEAISLTIIPAMLSGVVAVMYLAVMLVFSPPLAVIGVVAAVANLVIVRLMRREQERSSQLTMRDQGGFVGTTLYALRSIETVKATGAEARSLEGILGWHALLTNARSRFVLASTVTGAMPAFVTIVSSAALLVLGSSLVLDGSLSIGRLVAFQVLLAGFLAAIGDVASVSSNVATAVASIGRLNDVLDHPTEPRVHVTEPPEPPGGPLADDFAVVLDDVTFGYSSALPPLLTGFSLAIPPGHRVALVGGSGSGKSTVARIVAGLVEPWSGTVRFDGRPRESWDPRVLAAQLSMVSQSITMFAGTVRDNIAFFDDSVPLAVVTAAARDAAMHDEIAARPGGYDAFVDEGGRNFSGGQRQRMEIARALATDPRLLILDEATSALDAIVEAEIMARLKDRGIGLLIIAHRLSTVRDADEIVVLDQGSVVERGTHAQLVETDGRYAAMVAR